MSRTLREKTIGFVGLGTMGGPMARNILQHAAPRLISRDFTGIRMDITIKDLELETQVAKALHVPMFMANVALQVYQMGKAAGLGDEDPAAIVKVYEKLTGVSFDRA